MAKIQVLEVVSGFGLGGAEKALAARMNYLPGAFEHSVLNVRPEIDAFRPKLEFTEYKVLSRKFKRILEISRFLKANHFSVVIVRTPLDAIRFGFLKALTKREKFKLVFEAHSNFLTKKPGIGAILRFLLHMISQNIDLVIAVSTNVSQGPLCRGQKRVETIYLGSNLTLSATGVVSPKNPHLLFVGRLVRIKRPIWLLERIHNLSQKLELPKPTLTIVGSGVLEPLVRKFIEIKDMAELVNFVGAQDDVSPYFATATHLVSCSTNEGLPLTFFEAKLAGLSILSTPSGGGSEIFGLEDLEVSTFEEAEFEVALLNIMTTSPPSPEMRQAVQLNSRWMSAEEGAKRYYSAISRLLAN